MKSNFDSLYYRLSQSKVLRRGFVYAKTELDEEFSGANFYLQALEDDGNLRIYLKTLGSLIEKGAYHAQRPHMLELPKKVPFNRPFRLLQFDDSVVLYSIAYLFAPKIDRRLPRRVYATRLRKNYKKADRLFEDLPLESIRILSRRKVRTAKVIHQWPYLWVTFQKTLIRTYASLGFNHVIKLDVTGFFEHVHHNVLKDCLEHLLPRDKKLIEFLMKMLQIWTDPPLGEIRHVRGVGLPQGHEVSSFLANVYLCPLDEQLENIRSTGQIEWARYVDDLYIFGKSRQSVLEASQVVEGELRHLGLSLNTAKCEILKGPAIAKRLSHPAMDNINKLWRKYLNLKKKGLKSAQSLLLRGVKPYVKSFQHSNAPVRDEKKLRLLKRTLTILGELKSALLGKRVITELMVRENYEGGIWQKGIVYLCKLSLPPKDVKIFAQFLRKGRIVPAWNRAKVLQLFASCNSEVPYPMTKLTRIATDRNENWLVRKYSCVALGKKWLDETCLRTLRRCFISEHDPEVFESLTVPLRQVNPRVKGKLVKYAESIGIKNMRAGLFARFLKKNGVDK